MFERLPYCRRFTCLVWLSITVTATAQSNPSSEQSPPPRTVDRGVVGLSVATGHEARAVGAQPEDRLSRLAKQMSGPPEQRAVVLAPPSERQPLGAATRSAAEPSAPLEPQPADLSWVLNTLTALGVVVGVILLARVGLTRLSRRGKNGSNSSVMEVLSRVNLAPRSQVLLIRLGQRVLVVGDSSGGLRTLADISDPQEIAALLAGVAAGRPNSISQGFSQLFNRFNSDYTGRARRDEEGGDGAERYVDRARDQVSGLISRVRTMTGRGGGL